MAPLPQPIAVHQQSVEDTTHPHPKPSAISVVHQIRLRRPTPSPMSGLRRVGPAVHRLRRALSSPPGPGAPIGSYTGLTQLGAATETPKSPLDAALERVPNAHKGTKYLARFSCPEFTSICPVTGQPDFAHLVIDYVPDEWLVESKSLKLYLTSFRNHGDFHEACTVAIAKRLIKELDPEWLRIGGYWYPRGGIPIDVFFATGDPPPGVWIPDQGCPPYRGRG